MTRWTFGAGALFLMQVTPTFASPIPSDVQYSPPDRPVAVPSAPVPGAAAGVAARGLSRGDLGTLALDAAFAGGFAARLANDRAGQTETSTSTATSTSTSP